jgi:uncharacterized protein (DUF433 family)
VSLLSAFSLPTVAKITGLSEERLRLWDIERFFIPSLADPNRRRPFGRVYSFRDVVALQTIKRLLDEGIPIRQLKKLSRFLATLPEASWAETTFYVVDQKLWFTHNDAMLAARPAGQMVMEEIRPIRLAPIVADVERRIVEIGHRAEDQIGHFEANRHVMNGDLVFAGTRTPAAVVYELVQLGMADDEILREFPRLTPEDIRAVEHLYREPAALQTA